MAGRDPPPYLNTPEDRGGVVAVVSFTCIVISTFTNGVRIWNRQLSEAAFGLDDALLVAANVSMTEWDVRRMLLITHISEDHSCCANHSRWRKREPRSRATFRHLER